MTTTSAMYESHLPLQGRRQGKVRDLYTLNATQDHPARIVIVATDRLSAFDVVLPTPIPGKGCLLTDISTNWFHAIDSWHLCPTFVLSTDPSEIPGLSPEQAESIRGRVVIGTQCRVVPIECVVRGYIVGSGWKDYQSTGKICNVTLPKDLKLCDKLPEPIFTPATKADVGDHDENISFEQACDAAGSEVMHRLKDISLDIYTRAAKHAQQRGIILADTKFEFGFPVGRPETTDNLMLIDEALTPDSSRFWPADAYEPGRNQPSYDKQPIRDHLEELVAAGKWDRAAPGPELPDHIINKTIERYQQARELLFGPPATI